MAGGLGTKTMGSRFKSLPEIEKGLSSPRQCINKVDRLTQYPVKLMQYEEEPALRLAQKINQIIANSSTAAGMLQDIAQVLGIAFQVDCCCLVTFKGEASGEEIIGNWCAQEYFGLQRSDEIFSLEQLDLPVVQCACEPTIEDISTIQDSLAIGCQSLPLPIKAVLAITTRFGTNKNGVISLIKSQIYDWSESEKHLLRAVESVCAIAFSQIAQGQLIASQQQYLEVCARHQNLIKQLTILGRSNLELNQMLQLAIASTAESLGADRGLLILLKYADPLFRTLPKRQIPKAKANLVGEWVRTTESFHSSKLDTQENSFWLSECGVCQRVFSESSKAIILNDYMDRSDMLQVAPVFGLEQLPAMLLMPLESQGKILGFLVLQQAEARIWQAAEVNIIEMVCAQVSNVIIQTQTLRQVQMLVDERTAQLQRSLDVQAKLYEKQRQYVEQLRELNELKDEFLSNMSDRLRYPLTNMRMAIRILRQPGITLERQTKYLDILEEECSKEINLINDLLTLQKLETHQERPQFETIDLNTRIQEIAASFQKKLVDNGLRIYLDLANQALELQTELESFDRILQELLTNAGKFSERDTVVQLQAEHQVIQQVDRVIIRVINIGNGISEEEATYIFDKFRRGKGRWIPGTGLGLALVQSLVQHLNGEIAVESIPIENTNLSKICFSLTLPQFSDESKSYSESD
ncbi:GAF domain-containing sensor histidine kinase [Chlorogloeopsis sp. ULAP01]|uniref:GAF domain-containing sensor histidine kinase n=1 Tax=Chlorogloeopsis sp. ULAP01 TaxID=3056483 RepID=UPI0025AB419B|nr:GAF domain-containing sensor histidine kinase [Chlorogloeopsis sp. ULAP01]MDM9383120.1 GAF domain-containing sensor histidine kinase [Chlorogloeopsis sp. ULAP01]